MIYIIEENINPSTDYYIKPFLENRNLNFVRLNHKELQNFKLQQRAKIFIVRYLTDNVLKWMKANSSNIETIYYFMDDDLFDLKGLKDLPLRYAFKIFKKAWRFKNWLTANTKIFVSNEYLAEKYQKLNPTILLPYPSYININNCNLNPVNKKPVVFYHATQSHVKEFLWLKNFLNELKREEILFEVVVDMKTAKLYRGMKNLWIVNPMKWMEYIEFSSLKYRHIGLALLFDNHFNRARSYIKFYNIMRSSSVGIYSDLFPLARLIKEFSAGVLLPMEVGLWKKSVLELAKSEEKRNKIFDGAKKLLIYLKEEAARQYERISV
jgi:hypothetical protein